MAHYEQPRQNLRCFANSAIFVLVVKLLKWVTRRQKLLSMHEAKVSYLASYEASDR